MHTHLPIGLYNILSLVRRKLEGGSVHDRGSQILPALKSKDAGDADNGDGVCDDNKPWLRASFIPIID